MNLRALADLLDCRLIGPDAGPDALDLTSVASLPAATPSDLAFIADPKLAPLARSTRAGALLVSENFARFDRGPSAGWLISPEPALAAARALELLRPAWRPAPGIHPTASIHPSAQLGPDCHVGAFVAIGEGCRLGTGAVLHPHVVLYPRVTAGDRFLAHAHAVVREDTRIGHDVTLQPGVVVGGDGFGFTRRPDGTHAKIPQVGAVELGNRVEIQANSSVDRASLDTTRIGDGCIVDSLVQIAHNCDLGDNVILCAQVGLAGHTRIGNNAVLAGQVGVAGHCAIGDGVVITAQSGTHGDIPAGAMVSGSPAFDHGQWLRATAAFAKLGDLQREIRQLRIQLQKVISDQS